MPLYTPSPAISLPKINAGWFLDSSYAYGGARSTIALTAGTLYGTPLAVNQPVAVDQVVIEVASGGASTAGTSVRVGLMQLSPTTPWAATLITDIAALLTDSVGAKTNAFSYTFVPGIVYLPVVIPEAAVTIAGIAIARHILGSGTSTDSSSGRSGLLRAGQGYGALPASVTFTATTGGPPRILFRAV